MIIKECIDHDYHYDDKLVQIVKEIFGKKETILYVIPEQRMKCKANWPAAGCNNPRGRWKTSADRPF